MKNITIHKARRKDYKKLAKIYSEEFSKPPYKEDWTQKKAIKKLKQMSHYCDIYDIKKEKESIGFIVINPNFWFPGKIIFEEEMAIKQEYQSKGIGKEIVTKVHRIYKEKGYKEYMGIVDINSKSYHMHKKLGSKKITQNILVGGKL